MQNIAITTKDGLRFEKVGECITASYQLGGYRKIDDGEEFFYYTDLIEISDEQKLEFEGRVREIIRKVELFEGKL
jgi:hypothetical protein